MIELEKKELKAWALARSIFGANQIICEDAGRPNCFAPRTPFQNSIFLSSHGGLEFSYDSLEKLVGKGFSLPRMKSFFRSPILCFRSVFALLRINNLYGETEPSFHQVQAIFRASVEATLAYANHHAEARGILMGERGSISFVIKELGELIRVGPRRGGLWEVLDASVDEKPAVILCFQNLQIAYLSALGQTNHLTDPVTGKFILAGRIPLIEKFGFVSRLVFNDLPMPKR